MFSNHLFQIKLPSKWYRWAWVAAMVASGIFVARLWSIDIPVLAMLALLTGLSSNWSA
jgi:hypothetical protein